MIISCNTIVDKRDHVQYLTDSKNYSDNCTFFLTERWDLYVIAQISVIQTHWDSMGRKKTNSKASSYDENRQTDSEESDNEVFLSERTWDTQTGGT